MKIEISKEKEVVYYNVDDSGKKVLNFENLVNLSEDLIDLKDADGFEYEVIAGSDLQLYKETIEKVFESILGDKELLSLLNEDAATEEQEEKEISSTDEPEENEDSIELPW